MVFSGRESYAQNHYPGVLTISDTAHYCVGFPTPSVLHGSFTQLSCTGAFAPVSVSYQWYYNFSNSTAVASATPVGGIGTINTTAGGGTVIIPAPTPSTAVAAAYYYFCVLTWGNSGCVTAGSDTSNTNLILVGAPALIIPTLSPNPICAGDSVYFGVTSVGATSYTWNGPAASGFLVGSVPPPFAVNISDAGVYTVTAHNSCGDTTATVNLVINNPISFISASITPDTICHGDTLFLHDSVVGGTNVIYSWSGPGYSYTSTLYKPLDTLIANTTNTGIYTFSATSQGCPSPPAIVTQWVQVDTMPNILSVSLSTNNICTNYPITLLSTSLYGTSYLWTGGHGGYTSTLLHPAPFLTTLADTGVYYLTVSNSCGSVTDSTNHLILRKSPAPITGATSFLCGGGEVDLSDTTVGGYWYSSNPTVASVNSVGQVTTVWGGPGTETVVIYYRDGAFCYDSVIIEIGERAKPIQGSATLCVDEQKTLTDPTIGGLWTSSNISVASINLTTGVITGVSAGSVTISYTTPGCAPATFTVTVIAAPDPIIGLFKLCLGSTTTFNDNTPGGTWSTTNTSVATISASGVATALNLGIDTIIYTAGLGGCFAKAPISVGSLPNITISGPTQICLGDCATLIIHPKDSATYHWRPNTGISCELCDSVTACPLETQNYVVEVTNSYHCKDSVNFKLTVNPLPSLTYSPDPFFKCRYTDKQIQAFGAATYKWYPNVYIDNDAISNPTFSDQTDLVYTLTGTSVLGCVNSIRVPVSVLDSSITSLSPDTIICLGHHTRLIAKSDDPTTSYKWYIMPGYQPALSLSNDTDSAPIATPTTTTTYMVVMTQNACYGATRYVTVFVDPMPALLLAQPNTIIAGSSVTLAAVITNGDTGMIYEWAPPETVSCPSCPTTAVTPTVTTTYSVCVTTNRGCISCDSVTVHIMCDNSQVFIPNTFSPNGDGYNDKFIISGKGLALVTHLTIYNRWGQVMYDVQNIPPNDMTYGWDGNYQGQILEPDVFMYTLEVLCETDGVKFKYHGDISLVR